MKSWTFELGLRSPNLVASRHKKGKASTSGFRVSLKTPLIKIHSINQVPVPHFKNRKKAVLDQDLEIREGGGHQYPEIRGGGGEARSPKKLFQFGLKIRGGRTPRPPSLDPPLETEMITFVVVQQQ